MTIVGLDLHSASTITVRYDVSWIVHVDKQLPSVAKRGIIYARQVVGITCFISWVSMRFLRCFKVNNLAIASS